MKPWRIAQATVQGASHIAEFKPCQDANLVDFIIEGGHSTALLIAVADGAGSASLSHLGSKIACIASICYLKMNSDALSNADTAEACVRMSFDAALHEIEQYAQHEGVSPHDLATTLQVAAVGDDFTIFGQIGDGAIVWGNPGELRIFHWPDQEALNVTDFITSAPLSDTLHVGIEHRRIRRMACMTDGIAPVLLDFRRKCPHSPAFERLFSECAAAPDPSDLSDDLTNFLVSPEVNRRTDDDKTLVLAVRDEEPDG